VNIGEIVHSPTSGDGLVSGHDVDRDAATTRDTLEIKAQRS